MHPLELRIPPLVLVAVSTAAILALGHFLPAANLPFPGHRAAAFAALLVGNALAVAGVMQFHRAHTTPNPMTPAGASSLVTAGLYRFTRNPMYLGMAIALVGVAAWHSTLPGYGLVALFCVYLTRFQIRPEERALREVFGERFTTYAARVRRWV